MLSVVLIIGAINLMSVKVFGELEFWFSFFKVATIIIMIAAGIGIIIWGIGNGGQPTGIHNLWSNGGFFSNGFIGMILSLQLVMFAYGGIEIIGITAGEAKDPKKSIPKAINSVPWRILVFYVGTLFVIMSIYPWNQVGTNGSPFVLTFQHMGITVAAGILNFVVITASLSAINSDVFGVGRMLHGMAEQGHAPKMFSKVSKRGIPWVTVVVMMLALLLAVYLNYIMPESVFLVIASLATFATVWVWIMILFSPNRLPPQPEQRAGEAAGVPAARWGVHLGGGDRVPGVHHRPDRLLPDHARLAVRRPGLGGIAAGGILVQGQPSEKTRAAGDAARLNGKTPAKAGVF